MSFTLNSSGLKISSNTGKILFDSDRPTPHIIGVVMGSLTSGNISGTSQPSGYIGGTAYEWNCSCISFAYNDFYSSSITPDNTFVLPYYRVNLPVSNSDPGAYPVGDTNGSWVSANGGYLLRAYSSMKQFPISGAQSVQGTQFVQAYVPQTGYLRVMVNTHIFGHSSPGDAIFTGYVQAYTTVVVPHTSFTVDYKIFIGTT